MCGIVGGTAKRNIAQILMEGLKRLEYRGYDSAGIAILDPKSNEIKRQRCAGKVANLAELLQQNPLLGPLGIAHTRWATHGKPSTENAHPHCSQDEIAVVHNGIIENHDALREKLIGLGYHFHTDTDTEVVAHLLHYHTKNENDFLSAIRKMTTELAGAFALGIVTKQEAHTLYAVRSGSPLVIGVGVEERFIASDPLALLPVTQKFIYLEEGDIAILKTNQQTIIDNQGNPVERPIQTSEIESEATSKGKYRHFMQKEIFEQPQAILDTLNGHILGGDLNLDSFDAHTLEKLKNVKHIQLIACGTSYHAGLVASYWIESMAKISCRVEVASEFRYRHSVVPKNSLFVALSQSGETADTLAALRQAKKIGFDSTLAICNVPESSLAREADFVFLTNAGTEVGVAATKTFTAQLVSLMLLTLCLTKFNNFDEKIADHNQALTKLPQLVRETLELDNSIRLLSQKFIDKNHALFLGRGVHYPIALEGALKLKEISYIHAEAYPAGELKHGPLALVDKEMPVIVIAPKDHLIEKLESNIQEVQARQGDVFIFMDESVKWKPSIPAHVIKVPKTPLLLSPLIYTIPLQLMAYHIAVLKGTDVDQPRNLAKSVTVE